jgi:hypothetical protein
MFKLDATLKTFFDRKAVINAVDKAELRVLKKFGAFVRRRSRSSIRKKTNDPGRDSSGKFVSQGRRRVVQDKPMHYQPRPFMGPAFATELRDSLPIILKDCVTK